MDDGVDDGKGITEEFWSKGVTDDAKMMWRVGSRGVTFLAALLLPKTGFKVVDIAVGVLTMLIPLLVIETQRAYSKFSPGFLAWVVRISVFASGVAMASLGLVIYAWVVGPVVSVVGLTFFQQAVSLGGHGNKGVALFVFWCIAIFTAMGVIHAVIKQFREMKIFELVYHLPRNRMEWLMQGRPLRASDWPMFVWFELCVLITSFLYTFMASQAALLVVDGTQQVLMSSGISL
ncbi:hypothetical protein NJH78_27825 [Pseudomonas chlororaphis]|uniref:hypothetical protein n=1 Tax=Pseudomonas chlororaphis TaxID=587753 RepID=UPI00209B17AD|nr:hypothetical protein [Pseudomonas chlororaphis]MCO7573808.1 hypothetical protein [Pseudomonas chlororaphis]MCO7592160.1 hypothetical protein [Pseudomonas chlororaphis]